MRPLGNGDVRGKYLLPSRIQQKRRLPVLAAAANCGDKMTDEAASQFRHEQHWCAPRADFTRAETGNGAPRTFTADSFRVLQFLPVARTGVPIVALHVVARSGEDHAAQCMRRGRIAPDESMCVAVDVKPLMRADRCALGIVDARVESERGSLAGFSDLDGAVRGHIPGMR